MDDAVHLSSALAERYAIEREIGRGGMATVYLARDTRHNRRVALKVLNPELGAVLGVERFLSEIQVTANLQHPNLLPLFDSGDAGGHLFYVMPYVEGESLRARLNREKQLPVEAAVHIATAIASALDYAHRHGVIHRDLKPENILMTEGEPLVADFGIALAVSNAGGNRITQTGLSLGTPHYMSPEQATGDRVIDARSDVYSLAAVTYEMLAGEPPHDGKTSQAIIAKVLTDKPRSLRLTRDSVPEHVAAAVERGLAKLPADRFATAGEFAAALSGGARAFAPVGPPPTTASLVAAGVARRWAPWALAAAGLALAAYAVLANPRGGTGDDVVVRYQIPVPADKDLSASGGHQVAISPNGRVLAMVLRKDGTRRVYLRASDELESREVPGSETASDPVFSPDGVSIAWFANNQVLAAPVGGGRPRVITEGTGARGLAWTTRGVIVGSNGAVLTRTPAIGGRAEPFTRIDSAAGETGQFNPVALDDGKTILYTSQAQGGGENARIGVADVETGRTVLLDLTGSFPLGMLDGYLIYTANDGTMLAVRFDADARRVTGQPFTLVDQAAVSGITPISYAQMSPDGSLVYVSGIVRRQMVLVDPRGIARNVLEPGAFQWPRFSPDGERFAYTLGGLSNREVWTYQLPTGPATRVAAEGNISDRPEWMPDGRHLLFRSNQSGRNAMWSKPVDGGAATLVYGRTESQVDEGVVSPDGRYLLFQRDSTGNGEVWYRALQGDTTARQVARGTQGVYGGRFSPDGRWIVFTSTETGVEEVYVRPFPGLGAQYRVSMNRGGTPVWSPDGRRIYYVAEGQLMAATIGSQSPFSIARHTVVLGRGYSFGAVHADYDVRRDGTVLAFQSPNEGTQIVVVRNLRAELRARVQDGAR